MVMTTGFEVSQTTFGIGLVWIFLVGSFAVLAVQPLLADKPYIPREVFLNKYGTIENGWFLAPLALFAPAKRSLCLIRLGF